MIVTGVDPRTQIPTEYSLSQNYPNPFNPTTNLRFGLPTAIRVQLSVFNALGQEIARLVDGELDAGYHEIAFDAGRFSSGVYFYRLQAGEYVQVRKLILVR